jgi:hypothetical protein
MRELTECVWQWERFSSYWAYFDLHLTSFHNNSLLIVLINLLTPNSHHIGRTAPLTSSRCILNIYSTNIRAEYFKHAA